MNVKYNLANDTAIHNGIRYEALKLSGTKNQQENSKKPLVYINTRYAPIACFIDNYKAQDYNLLNMYHRLLGFFNGTNKCKSWMSRIKLSDRKIYLNDSGSVILFDLVAGVVFIKQITYHAINEFSKDDMANPVKLAVEYERKGKYKKNPDSFLYNVTKDNLMNIHVSPRASKQALTSFIGVNDSSFENINDAAKLMYIYISRGYSTDFGAMDNAISNQNRLHKDGKNPVDDPSLLETKNLSYDLFYNTHRSKSVKLKKWASDVTGWTVGSSDYRAHKLAAVIMQSKQKAINWTLHGDGVKIFSEALKIVASTEGEAAKNSYNSHSVVYINSTAINAVTNYKKDKLDMA